MGAKLKEGIDYFPHFTNGDLKYSIVRAYHRDGGYVILDFLLKEIHGRKGYFKKWNERHARIFAMENSLDFETVIAVVETCFEEDIFDRKKYEEHGILTSKEVQEVWLHVAKERKEIIHVQEYLLIDISPYLKSNNNSEPAENQNNIKEVLAGVTENNSTDVTEIKSSGNNGISPPDNPENLVDNQQRKDSKGKEVNQPKEIKQGKESEAFKFSLSAISSEKSEGFSRKKVGIKGDNFVILTNENENFESGNLNEFNTGIDKNLGQKSAENQEIQSTNPEENNAGNQENLFSLGPENQEHTDNNQGKIKGSSTQNSREKKSSRKAPHPARSQLIQLWEERFGQPYQNSLGGNQAINHIIRHLDKLIRRAREGDLLEDHVVNEKIVELWKVILVNWEKLEKFYRNLIQFESIAKYLTEIINQLKEYGTDSTRSKQSTGTSGQKPSFDRFRNRNG